MQYEKLTVERFAERLAAGDYKDLTGSRRAIGKTSSWSAKEKERAHALANAHFGGSPAAPTAKAPAAKTAKKAAAKKPVQPAKAVPATKPAPAKEPVAPKAPVAAKAASKAPAKKAAAKKVTQVRSSATGSEPKGAAELSDDSSFSDALFSSQGSIELADKALELVRKAHGLDASVDIRDVVREANDITLRSLQFLSRRHPMQEKTVKDPPGEATRVSVPRAAPATRPVLAVNTDVQAPKTAVATTAPTPAAVRLPAPQMTEEEKRTAEAFHNAPPASTIAGLPLPTS